MQIVVITQTAALLCFAICFVDADDLPHMAVTEVPAVLGKAVQLRCSKILELSKHDYSMSSMCHPNDDSCYYAWSKDDELVDFTTQKYSTDSVITYDYCENFEGTKDILNNIDPSLQRPYDDREYREREMMCYTSSLTIRDVEMSDFGSYSCNFSYHSRSTNDWYDRGTGSVQNITLYNINDNTVVIPEKVDYFQSFYVERKKDSILSQCVVSGALLKWEIDILTHNYCDSYTGTNCSLYSGPLDKSRMGDYWRCFNFTEVYHSPFKGVTESVVYFSNVCPVDSAQLYCNRDIASTSDDTYPKPNQPVAYIKTRSGDYWEEYYEFDYDRDLYIGVTIAIVLPLVAALLIAAVIVALVRANCCKCCNSSTPQIIYQYAPLPQPQN